jgi:hypothetical protein
MLRSCKPGRLSCRIDQEQAKTAARQLYSIEDDERQPAGETHLTRLLEGNVHTGDALQVALVLLLCDLEWPMRRARHRKVRASLEEDMLVIRNYNEESTRLRQCMLDPTWASEILYLPCGIEPDLVSKIRMTPSSHIPGKRIMCNTTSIQLRSNILSHRSPPIGKWFRNVVA